MRCYYVYVHGRLAWREPPKDSDGSQPKGFYCYRFVLAADREQAIQIVFQRVRAKLDRDTGWLSNDSAELTLELDEVAEAPYRRLLEPIAGRLFYDED